MGLILGIITAFGCDPYGEAVVTVEIPAAVHSALTDLFPIQVIAIKDERPCAEVVGILCEATDDPVRYQWHDGSVCPGDSTVRFSVVPLVPEQAESFRCGQQDEVRRCLDAATLPESLTRELSLSIFQGKDCNEGTERHRVFLELK